MKNTEDTANETNDPEPLECKGHPAGPYDQMGQTVYCDGTCRRAIWSSNPALIDPNAYASQRRFDR